MSSPKTLQEAILHYSDPKNCIADMVAQRWPDGKVTCPTCGRNDVTWQEKSQRWQCKSQHSKRKFSVKVGTIYEDSPAWSRQVAHGYLDAGELQKWRKQL